MHSIQLQGKVESNRKVEIDSIEIDGQKGRARRVFDDDAEFYENAASFDDSIVERIKLMKDVEDESLAAANDDDASAPRASSSSARATPPASGATITIFGSHSKHKKVESKKDQRLSTPIENLSTALYRPLLSPGWLVPDWLGLLIESPL